jgi:hypothetical protein
VGFHANVAIDDLVFSFELRNVEGTTLMRTDTGIMGNVFDVPVGPGTIQIQLEGLPLLDGDFEYCVGVENRGGMLFDWRDPGGAFEVMNAGKTTGLFYVSAEATMLTADTEALAESAAGMSAGAEVQHQASQIH